MKNQLRPRTHHGTICLAAAALCASVFFCGCPRRPSLEAIDAVKQASLAQQGLDVVYGRTLDALNALVQDNVAPGGGGKGIVLTREIDRTVDLDDDSGGSDIAPNTSGQLQVTGTLTLDTDITSGTLDFQDLTVVFLTDVVVTEPDTQASCTFGQGASIVFDATGSYVLTVLTPISTQMDLTVTITDMGLGIVKEDATELDLVWGASVALHSTYRDESLLDGLPGTRTLSVEITSSSVWTEGDVTKTVTTHVVIDPTTNPPTEAITVAYNGLEFGPYTRDEFADVFDVILLVMGV